MTRYAPLWNQGLSYPAQLDRGLINALWPGGGVLNGAVTAVVNTMQISVAAGFAAVPMQSGQGSELCHWDAPEAGPSLVLAASPPSGQSRVDLIVVQVRDAAVDGGANNDFVIQAIAGTPAAAQPGPAGRAGQRAAPGHGDRARCRGEPERGDHLRAVGATDRSYGKGLQSGHHDADPNRRRLQRACRNQY